MGECCANDVLEQAENGQVQVDIMTFAASLPCSSHSQDLSRANTATLCFHMPHGSFTHHCNAVKIFIFIILPYCLSVLLIAFYPSLFSPATA